MSGDSASIRLKEELSKKRARAIKEGIFYILVEAIFVMIAISEPHPVLYACRNLFSCDNIYNVLGIFPPFYVICCVTGLLIVVPLFIMFILSYENQADLSKIGAKPLRPTKLVAIFIVTSLVTTIMLFASLHHWTGIYGDTVLNCKDAQCASSSVIVHDIWECLYFSIITITTVGYGDYHPMNSVQSHIITSAEALSGYIILGVLVSSLSTMLRRAR